MSRLNRWFSRLSLTRKLMAIGVVTAALSLLVACGVFLVYDYSTSRSRLVLNNAMLADVIGRNSTAALAFGHQEAAEQILAGLTLNEHIVSAAVISPDGRLLARFDRVGSPRLSPAAIIPPVTLRTGGPWHEFTDQGLILIRPIVLGTERVGAVFIQSDLEEIWTRVTNLAQITLAALAGAFWLALTVSIRLQKAIAAPLLTLTETTRVVTSERRYDLRVDKAGDDEIGELVEGF